MLLERVGDRWQITCSHIASPPNGISCDPGIADAVAQQRETLVFQSAPGPGSRLSANETAVFAAPVFNEDMEVVAVVYGSRSYCTSNRLRSLRPHHRHQATSANSLLNLFLVFHFGVRADN
ncbi:MAG: hypothetical protein GY768_13945 [Planctomycetaceae bacterium]|nr:hypothetical protein [Planctomycetaceae bacterium]